MMEQCIVLPRLRPRPIEVESHETLASAELPKRSKKKRLVNSLEISDNYNSSDKMENPLRNIEPIGKSKASKPSVNSKCGGSSIKSKSVGIADTALLRKQPMEPDISDLSVNSKLSNPSVKSETSNLSVKSQFGDSSEKSLPKKSFVKTRLIKCPIPGKSDPSDKTHPEDPSLKCKPFVKSRYPLRNIKSSEKSNLGKSSVIWMSKELVLKAKLVNPAVDSKSGDPFEKPELDNFSEKSKLDDHSKMSDSGNPFEKQTPIVPTEKVNLGDPSEKFELDDSSVKSNCSNSLEPPRMLKLSDCKLTAELGKELVIVNKKCLETGSDSGLHPSDVIEQFISTRKYCLISILSDFIEADSFNSAVDKKLGISNVYAIRTETPENVRDWHLFQEYWYRFKQQFSIMTVKFNQCYPESASSDVLWKYTQKPIIMVYHGNTGHCSMTNEEFDTFLRTDFHRKNVRMPEMPVQHKIHIRFRGTKDEFHHFLKTKSDLLRGNAQMSEVEVQHKNNVHYPRTKDEFDHFLSTMVDIYNIVENILSICHSYFDGFSRHCVDSSGHLFPRYIEYIRFFLFPLCNKLKIEVQEFKLFEIKV